MIVAVVTVVTGAAADEPWYVTGAVEITEPTELGQVIVLPGASLTVRDLPEPGFTLRGHLWVVGDGRVRLERSVIQFLSVYHGQYSFAGIDEATIEIVDCDYRVPNGVQHALLAVDNAHFLVENTDFGDIQLLAANHASFEARQLTGNFEVVVQNDASMVLEDIPRVSGAGAIWVWVEFPDGCEAEYSPPMPGFVGSWTFPPTGATGIGQRVVVDRCDVRLWPMLVCEGSRVVLRDVAEDNWIVVGFHMPGDATVAGLENNRSYVDFTLDLQDREFRVVDATVDTWNLYPQGFAHVVVRDSLVGEVLSLEDSRVWLDGVTVDGTGGFFGARDRSRMFATGSRFTCTIEASQEATIELHASSVEPYSIDPTGAWTRFGAYDDGRLLADQTPVVTTPALAGRGLIALSYLRQPPPIPPGPGEQVILSGSIGMFSLDPEVAAGYWRLQASTRDGRPPVLLATGTEPVEDGELAVWSDARPALDHRLQTVLVDGLGRTMIGSLVVPGTEPRVR
jgi:hypothetical protein